MSASIPFDELEPITPAGAGLNDVTFCKNEKYIVDAANESLLRLAGIEVQYYILKPASERQPPGAVGGDPVYDVPVRIDSPAPTGFAGDPIAEVRAWDFEGPFDLRGIIATPFRDPYLESEKGGEISFEGMIHFPIKEFRDKIPERFEPVEGDIVVIPQFPETGFDIIVVERTGFFGTDFTAVDCSVVRNEKFTPERRLESP